MAHSKWFLRPRDLVGLTPAKARDLIAQCFFESQKDTYVESRRVHGREPSYDEVRKLVQDTVRRAFDQAGHNYDRPTKQALKDVVNVLMKKAAVWKSRRTGKSYLKSTVNAQT
jgi:hypothetical protein